MSEAELFERYIQEMLHNCNVCTVEGWREYYESYKKVHGDDDEVDTTAFSMDDIDEWCKQLERTDFESDDLYIWSVRMAKGAYDLAHGTEPLRSAWFAARKMCMILLTFTREREGQEITPEMLEEMRKLCARVAYD